MKVRRTTCDGRRSAASGFHTLFAQSLGKVGSVTEALAAVEEGLAEANRLRVRYYEAEIFRTKGEFTADAGSQAEECFFQAIKIARQQNAKSLEPRAVTSLSRLYRKRTNANRPQLC
jgi:hypothetical protein